MARNTCTILLLAGAVVAVVTALAVEGFTVSAIAAIVASVFLVFGVICEYKRKVAFVKAELNEQIFKKSEKLDELTEKAMKSMRKLLSIPQG